MFCFFRKDTLSNVPKILMNRVSDPEFPEDTMKRNINSSNDPKGGKMTNIVTANRLLPLIEGINLFASLSIY